METLKLLYDIDNASQEFCLKIKEILLNMCLKVMPGDGAFYFLIKKGVLKRTVLTNVDDFQKQGLMNFQKGS